MKKKRIKSSNFPHSTKKKQRKQENSFPTPLSFSQIRGYMLSEEEAPAPKPDLLKSDYSYKKTEEKKYRYEFTNYRLIYVLGTMESRVYLIFITVIALLIAEDLNKTERKIIYAFFLNLGDTLQTIVDQDEIIKGVQDEKESRELGNALDKDLSTLYEEINKLKRKAPNL